MLQNDVTEGFHEIIARNNGAIDISLEWGVCNVVFCLHSGVVEYNVATQALPMIYSKPAPYCLHSFYRLI